MSLPTNIGNGAAPAGRMFPEPSPNIYAQHLKECFDSHPAEVAAADAAVKAANRNGQPCYLVLSVRDLRRMLKKAEGFAKLSARGDASRIGNSCFSFESTVRPDSRGDLQVQSYDIAKGPR